MIELIETAEAKPMTTDIQIFNHPDFGGVRVLGDSDNPRFCLSDVCKVLGVGNPSDVKKRLDDGVVSIEGIVDSLGRTQEAYFVNEDGLYDVILDSRKPEAKKFRKWITSEVLPSIRKHGVYATGDFLSKSIANPAWAIGVLTELKAKQEEAALLEQKLAEAKSKADYCDAILQCRELVATSVIAKDYGYSAKAFNKLLHELGVQFKQGELWLLYQSYAQRGWTQTKTHKYVGADGKIHCNVHMYWTQKGRLELYYLLKDHDYLPLIEQVA